MAAAELDEAAGIIASSMSPSGQAGVWEPSLPRACTSAGGPGEEPICTVFVTPSRHLVAAQWPHEPAVQSP